MAAMSRENVRPVIEWGWAGRALEHPSGDLHVVVEFEGGALVALIDGLGHGLDAAQVSRAAAAVLEAHANEAADALLERCHESLRKTRGAVMSIASLDARSSALSWVGVGNVEGVLLRARGAPKHSNRVIAVRGGVVGFQLPPLRIETLPISPDDTLIMASDGIGSGFSSELPLELTPQELAESILVRFGKQTDDAHVVVARYLGESP
jgi:hypothetical protein